MKSSLVMLQLQRSSLLLGPPNTLPSSIFSKPSTSSSLKLNFFMSKLQYRGLQENPSLHLPCLPSGFSNGNSNVYRKCSQLKFNKVKVSCMSLTNHGKDTHLLRSPLYGSRSAFHLRVGLLNDIVPLSTIIYGARNSCIGTSLAKHLSFNRRFFSPDASLSNKRQNIVLSGKEGSGSALGIQASNKQQKQAKALTAQSKKGENSDISASKDVDRVISSEQLAGDRKEDMELGSSISTSVKNSNQNSKSHRDQRKRSGSKKSKVGQSGSDASEKVVIAKGSKSSSQAKRSSVGKKGKDSSQASEPNSIGSTRVEVLRSATSSEPLSNKKSGNFGGKGKSGMLKQLYPPSGKSVVVVESVTKAKVIQGYLGDLYEVLPSYGHVRDLAARSGSVRPDQDFSMLWEVPSAAWTHLKSIKVALSGAENLILASDPDREGEAIAWHIVEMLQQQEALPEDISIARVVFHEITEASIKSALQSPREIDANLVHAYLARRALDYLIGFNISPLLWRKLPGCQSAGRVQSAALSLICDREMEINEFKPHEYWSIEVQMNKNGPDSLVNDFCFPAHLSHYDSKKLSQLSISSVTEAKDIEEKIKSMKFLVISTKRNKMRKNPPTPYITSTLQQDAANKLHFSAAYTMKLAQKLYEGVQLSDGKAAGLITYTRTDGLHLSDEAVKDIRTMVIERFGQEFASGSVRKYFKKVKNAQEAHEAIRPTDIRRLPSLLVGALDEDSLKLYTLIWSRTVACQMEPAIIEQMQLDAGDADQSIILHSACLRVDFLGYQAVFEDIEAEAIRNKENDLVDRNKAFGILNSLKRGNPLYLGKVELKQHNTQPPPRYSEGSLVKKLEELGIGRPSTYASTLKVLQDRNYVTVKSRILYPEFRGRMVQTDNWAKKLSLEFQRITKNITLGVSLAYKHRVLPEFGNFPYQQTMGI